MSSANYDPRGNANVADVVGLEYGANQEQLLEKFMEFIRWLGDREPVAPGDPFIKFATRGYLVSKGLLTENDVLGNDDDQDPEIEVEPEMVVVHAREMFPSVTNGCGTLTITELASTKPNLQTLEFVKVGQTAAQFMLIMPPGWVGGSFQFRVYWSHSTGGSTFGTAWQLRAHSVTDGETMSEAFSGSMLVTDTGGTADDLYISPESDPVQISGTQAKAGDLVMCEISRIVTDSGDTLNIPARLHAIRFNVGDAPAEFPAIEGSGLIVYEAEDTAPGGVVTSGPSAARSEFMARLSIVSDSESFDGTFEFEGDTYPFEDALTMTGIGVVVNGVTATFSDGVISSGTGSGRFNTTSGGAFYVQLGGEAMLSLTFDSPIAAFGAYLTDVGDFVGQVSATLHKTGGGTVDIDLTHTVNGPNASLMFWGFVDDVDTYDSIDIVSSSAAEAIGLDDMVIATAAQLA